MSKVLKVGPITRISGPLTIEIKIEKNQIIEAQSRGVLFRGFEKMLKGRPPLDAIYYTERICGICSSSHGLVSALALEEALKITPDENGKRVREFLHGAEYLQNIIRQIAVFAFPDYAYIKIAPVSFNENFRLNKIESEKINKTYEEALNYGKLAHEMVAILGGKVPHTHGIFVGGSTAILDPMKIIRLKSILEDIYFFIKNSLITSMEIVSKRYSDYFNIGTGVKNLLTFGVLNSLGENSFYVNKEVLINGKREEVEPEFIKEDIKSSWYRQEEVNGNLLEEVDLNKKEGYSFIKAPRYKGDPMEVGPIARMILSKKYPNKISTMDRLMARALEGEVVCKSMLEILKEIEPKRSEGKQISITENSEGLGMVDAVRGALSHYIKIQDKTIGKYDIITPSAWNLSPKDDRGIHGPLEQALIGTEIEDIKKPIEIGRIIRSFDPCVSCATHIVSDNYYKPIEVIIT